MEKMNKGQTLVLITRSNQVSQIRKTYVAANKHSQMSYQTWESKSGHNYVDSPPKLFSHVPVDKPNYLKRNKVYTMQSNQGRRD